MKNKEAVFIGIYLCVKTRKLTFQFNSRRSHQLLWFVHKFVFRQYFAFACTGMNIYLHKSCIIKLIIIFYS